MILSLVTQTVSVTIEILLIVLVSYEQFEGTLLETDISTEY